MRFTFEEITLKVFENLEQIRTSNDRNLNSLIFVSRLFAENENVEQLTCQQK